MRHVSKVDMAEVTRLTREGRLDDAMAMLRGEAPAARPGTPHDGGPEDGGSLLDMTRPESSGAWTLAGDRRATAGGHAARKKPWPTPASGPLTAGPFGHSGGFAWPSALGGVAPAGDTPGGGAFAEHVFRGTAGSLGYKLYVPAGYDEAAAPVPLVVMLHGCTQSPDDFAAGTRMNALAEEFGFLVVYPAQSQRANAQRCWNWFQTADQQRDTGEAALIAGIARGIIESHNVDPALVYAAGLSAGGAAVAILGQRHPALFAAVGIHSGLACGAAEAASSAFAAMQGRAPLRSMSGDRPIPTIVFHGDGDRTVAPVNGEQVLEQATAGRETATTVERGRSTGGIAYTRTVHTLEEAGRTVRFENWVLHGGGHAWSGGSPEGSYTEPDGPDASRAMLRFFAEASRPPASEADG